MVRNFMKFSNSVAFKWIISYAVIMIIPLIVSAIVYLQTTQIIEYEIRRASNAMLNQVKFIVDNELKQTEKLAAQLTIQPDIKKYLQIDEAAESENAFHIYQTEQELSKYKSINDFISGIYIYSSKLDKVLTNETYADSKLFYEMTHQSPQMTYDTWLASVREQNQKKYQWMPITESDRPGETVVFMESLTNKVERTQSGMLMMPINRNNIQHLLENVDWVNRGRIFIVDQHDEILFQNRNGETVPKSYFQSLQGSDSMTTIVESDTTAWRYVSVFPSDVFWERAREIRNLNLIGLLICCLIGAGVISYFARKNYGPVRELVHVFSRFKKESEGDKDEYAFIRESVLATLRERDDMNNQQHQQFRVLQGYYLSRLLKGHMEESLSVEEAAEIYRLQWTSEQFTVLLFHMELAQDSRKTSLELSHFIVSNIVMDLIRRRHLIHFTDLDGMLGAIVNINPLHANSWKEDIEQALSEALEFIEQRYGLIFAVAGSERQDGLKGIHQGFLQALEAREYSLLLNEDGFIWYGNVKQEETDYYYSMNDELILINVIKVGDLSKATELLDELIEGIFSRQSSIEMIKCAMIDLASTMMKTIPLETSKSAIWEERRPVKRLLSCSTRAEFRRELLEIVTLVCERVQTRISLVSNMGIGNQVEEFVKSNFTDDNLSVSMIGAHFGITPQYVSKVFKTHAGQGLHDYISQIRIGEAKLLLDEGASIDETALKVGFTSSSAFIRVFKKYEGITPGRYKSLP